MNNAAAAIYEPLAEFPLKRRRIMFEANVHAPLDLAQAVIPAMRAAGEGWIVNVSSGSRPAVGRARRSSSVPAARRIAVYGASKAALNRITNGLAAELHGTGIRVNTVEPRAAVLSEGAAELVGDDAAARPDRVDGGDGRGGRSRCATAPTDVTGQVAREPRPDRRLGPHRPRPRREPAMTLSTDT